MARLRWPRLLPPQPFIPAPQDPDVVWCQTCSGWQGFDVIPGNAGFDIPAFVVCVRCGGGVQYDLEETA